MRAGSLPLGRVVALSLLIQVILVLAAAAADWRINDGKPMWASFSMYVAIARLVIPMAPLLVIPMAPLLVLTRDRDRDKAMWWKSWSDYVLGSGSGKVEKLVLG